MSPTDTADADRAEFAARLEEERAAFAARLRAEFDVRSPARIQQDVDRLKAALGRLGFDVTWRGLRLALDKSGYSLRESASLSFGIVVKTLEARVEAQDRIEDQAKQKASSETRKATRAPEDRPPERQQWLTERQFAERFGIARQSLANWRYRDKLSGRTEAAPDYPTYRRFGKAVRYLIEDGQPVNNRLPEPTRRTQ
jgi:hypothetical protein